MSFSTWLRGLFAAAPSPTQLSSGVPVVREKPLHEQFGRIGGGLTPAQVSAIISEAVSGQPARLVDLGNESRQKDGHLHGAMATRDMAVSLYPFEFLIPDDASAEDKAARDLCVEIYDHFEGFGGLVKHLTRSYFPGHATGIIKWRKRGGKILPHAFEPIHAREMIFERDRGQLRYRTRPGDQIGVDLLAEFPGQVVQLQRSIMGDVPSRDGLIQLLVWMAIFRNWDLREWIALGEIGWKPWRTGVYGTGASEADVESLVRALEDIGTTGVGVFPDKCNIEIAWPKSSGGIVSGVHRELYDAMGREISKAVLGQTTSMESGTNGTRSDTTVRDQIRKDIGKDDAIAVAACLHWQMFSVAVAVNIGPSARCPAGIFQTEEASDRQSFADAILKLKNAGVRMPARWVRDEFGMPEPKDAEETIGGASEPDPNDPNADLQSQDQPKPPKPPKPPAKPKKSVGDERNTDGPDYADALTEALKRDSAQELAVTAGALNALIEEVAADPTLDDRGKYRQLMQLTTDAYRDMAPPDALADLATAGFRMARLSGMAAVRREDGGMEPDE